MLTRHHGWMGLIHLRINGRSFVAFEVLGCLRLLLPDPKSECLLKVCVQHLIYLTLVLVLNCKEVRITVHLEGR